MEGGLDTMEASKLASIVAFSIDVTVAYCILVDALVSLHHYIMNVCSMLVDGYSHYH